MFVCKVVTKWCVAHECAAIRIVVQVQRTSQVPHSGRCQLETLIAGGSVAGVCRYEVMSASYFSICIQRSVRLVH